MPEKLPDYKSPPVVEVIGAVQFDPLPQFGIAEAVAVARAFDDYSVVDVPPALPPIVEARPGEPARQSSGSISGPSRFAFFSRVTMVAGWSSSSRTGSRCTSGA